MNLREQKENKNINSSQSTKIVEFHGIVTSKVVYSGLPDVLVKNCLILPYLERSLHLTGLQIWISLYSTVVPIYHQKAEFQIFKGSKDFTVPLVQENAPMYHKFACYCSFISNRFLETLALHQKH